MQMDISQYTEKNNENFLLVSNIPEVCKSEPCVLGIDEAGRGPVLGPMVYGIAFCPTSKNTDLKNLGVDDSKALTEEQREKLLDKVLDNNDYIGWAIHLLSPSYISTSMNRRGKYNLNAMSHDTAIGLVKEALSQGVEVAEVYVDTYKKLREAVDYVRRVEANKGRATAATAAANVSTKAAAQKPSSKSGAK